MTVSLGSVVLDTNLRLDGLYSSPGVAGSVRATMGGMAIQTMPMTTGKTLSLVATLNSNTIIGCFTGAQLSALAAIRDAGAKVDLVHHLYSGQVFLPPDAISVEQVFDYANPGATSEYVGTITLITA